jgi:hypothetical protein
MGKAAEAVRARAPQFKEQYMSIPSNFEEFVNPQSVRRSALHFQLLALEGQTRVIKALDIEHAFGIESTSGAELVLGHARDFVKSAEIVAERAGSAPRETTVASLKALRETARRISERASALDKSGLERAKMRLDQCLCEHAQIDPSSLDGVVPGTAAQMAVKAGVSCYRAEAEQLDTFALQVRALCDLALEYAYNAAVQSPAFKD